MAREKKPLPEVGSRVSWRTRDATVVWNQPPDIFARVKDPFLVSSVIIDEAKADLRGMGRDSGKFISGVGPGVVDIARPRCLIRLDELARGGVPMYAWVTPNSLTPLEIEPAATDAGGV